jgi:O-antigen ligase
VTAAVLDARGLRVAAVASAAGALSLLVGAAAAVAPLQTLTAVLALGFVAVAFLDLAAGLAVFTLLLFFELIPAVAANGVTLTKVAGAVLVVAAVRKRGRPFLARRHPVLWYVGLALAVWAFTSTLWAEDVGVAAIQAYRLALGFVLVTVVVAGIRERRHAVWMVAAYLLGALVAAVVGVATTPPDDNGLTRLGGAAGNPNELAAVLVPAVAFAAFAFGAVRGALPRLAFAAIAVTLVVAVFLTESRGGLVALGVTMLAAIALGGRMRPYLVALALVVAAVGVTYVSLVAPTEAAHRLMSAGGGSGRTDLWQVATRAVDDHPLTGVGAGNFPIVSPRYAAETIDLTEARLIFDDPHVVHNTYLEVLTELGPIGLALFGTFVAGLLWLAARAVRTFARRGDETADLLARGLLVGTIGLLTAYVFISGQYEKHLWLLLGLGAAFESLARARATRGLRTTNPPTGPAHAPSA